MRSDERELRGQVAALERENARVEARLARTTSTDGDTAPSGSRVAGPTPGRLLWPIDGTITSPFGPRWGRLHAGLDIGAPEGTPIKAADTGRVVLAGPQGAYGLYTCVQHSSTLSTCYAHQSRIATSVGAAVQAGQVIGAVGNTGSSFGAHLHFETRISGTPVDPMRFL